jgi:predicted site-specific integrase-resolvase
MSEQAIPKKLIPLNAAAKRLGVKPGTLYRWKCAGQHICFYKVIGGVKCDPEEIDRLIERSRIQPSVTA